MIWKFEILFLFGVSTFFGCGPGVTQQPPTTEPSTTNDQVSEMTGGTCLEPDDVNSPWLVGLDGTSRGTIASNAESGLVLVKQGECGTYQMLADCYIEDIQYKDKPAKVLRPDAVDVSNRRQLQKKVPLAVAKYAAQMDDTEHWSLDYVDAGEKSYSGSLPKIDWDKLRPACHAATHYVYKITRGAFQLSMVNESERVNEGNIGPADFKKRAERRKAEKSRDGDYAGCAASSDSSVSACGGLIRMWVEPIPNKFLPGNAPVEVSGKPHDSPSASSLDKLLANGDEAAGPPAPTPGIGTKEYKADLEKKWAAVKKAARKRDTEGRLELYQAFLSEFPVDNPYASQVRKKIDKWEAELSKAQVKRDRLAAEERKRKDALARQDEIRQAKERAASTTGVASAKLAAWSSFKTAYPDSDNPYLSTANRMIKKYKAQVKREEKQHAAKEEKRSNRGIADVDWIYSKPAGIQFTQTEVTLGQFKQCVNDGGCNVKNRKTNAQTESCNWGHSDRDSHPMNCVDWYGAKDYCEWIGGRLPTAYEWYAEASNGGKWDWPWGDSPPVSCSYAICGVGSITKDTRGCGKGSTWSVCSKAKGNSASGLCDIVGNVWEWTSTSEENDILMRGGSWFDHNPQVHLPPSSSGRPWGSRAYWSTDGGFRCVRLGTQFTTNSNNTGAHRPSLGKRSRAVEEWVTIPGGRFQMGSNSGGRCEKPVHSVNVPTFQMTKTEVTLNQYKSCVDAGKCERPTDNGDNKYCNWGHGNRGEHPINCVNWSQARRFCEWVGGRLPSEAEWEYAARSGGKNQKFPWGNTEASCSYAVMDENGIKGCGEGRTWPVCSKSRGNTSSGLCDMSGNVSEWVEDWYQCSYKGAPTNGDARTAAGHTEWHTLRGGALFHSNPSILRTTQRTMGVLANYTGLDSGFRCVLDGN